MKNLFSISVLFLALCVTLVGCTEEEFSDPTETTREYSVTKRSIDEVMAEFKECKAASESLVSCKDYPVMALCQVYGVNDFMKGEDEFYNYDEILEHLPRGWVRLGRAEGQETMELAQEAANEGRPAFAISSTNMAIIMPGELKTSSSWGLKCPNAACFFMTSPEKSFTSKSINYAWTSPEGVVIYMKK